MNIDPHLPVNKTAAFVVAPSEEKGAALNTGHMVHSLTPLPTTQFTGLPQHDLTGRKCGRFTVIGMAVHRAPGRVNTVRWVVRCACGRYEHMTSKAIKRDRSGEKEELACLACQQTKHLKHRAVNKTLAPPL